VRVLWASSSVGKGHVVRDLAVVGRLQALAGAEVDWLVPDPGGDYLRSRGQRVLEQSHLLAGSGKTYATVFAECSDEFNLMDYVRADTRLHKRDFNISRQVWKQSHYDVVVADEAFWLLTGFVSRWGRKPAPFIFITDFIGTKALIPRARDRWTAWQNNLKFIFSHLGVDKYVYIGDPAEIPEERLGFLLPGGRKWALRHCLFIKPIVPFRVGELPGKWTLRRQLGLSEEGPLFTAALGPEGQCLARSETIEQLFELLKRDYPKASFLVVGPSAGSRGWIRYERHLEGLYRYFAASDLVITQCGYGKVAELSALGVPFLAIPLDYHFEQEYIMGRRVRHYQSGELVRLREHTPQTLKPVVDRWIRRSPARVAVDDGSELACLVASVAGNKELKGVP
jgi:hypothetical protein